jgi:hypothetical protein
MSRINKSNHRTNKSRTDEPNKFTIVFVTVAIGAALCVASASVIAILLHAMTADEQKVFDALLSSFTLGVGAILGLLGSRFV